MLGAQVEVAGPTTLMPTGIEKLGVSVSNNFTASLEKHPDVVMMLRVQQERMQGSFFPSIKEYASNWSLSGARFEMLKPETKILHPGPMNRGFEISSQAADDPRSLVLRQVANGVSVRMAVLFATLAGDN